MNKWLDLFAGHGVGVAMRELGIEEYAVEIWQDAIDTRLLNGLSEPVYRDAWQIESADGLDYGGLWASPPCQTFSTAGSGSGRKALDDVIGLVEENVWKSPVALRNRAEEFDDPRTGLVLSPLAYVYRHRPTFVVLEQVTPVLPVWEAFVAPMRNMYYDVWTGVLDAADYGVPQTRKRAYLIASLDDEVVAGPPRTQDRSTMGDIRPDQQGLISNYSSGGSGMVLPGNKKPRGYRTVDQPAFTVTGKVRANRWYPSMELVSKEEALQMQSYPVDFKVSGDWSLQIGNAVPPKVAEAVLGNLAGMPLV